jgi:hypothetical protein
MIESRRMKLSGNVAQMGKRGMHIGYFWRSQKERDHLENQDISGWKILNWILERYDGMVWIGLIWLRIGTSGGLL